MLRVLVVSLLVVACLALSLVALWLVSSVRDLTIHGSGSDILTIWHLMVLLLIDLLDLLWSKHHWATLLGSIPEWLSLRESNWCWAQVLVWVEPTESSHFSDGGDLNHWCWLSIHWGEVVWAHVVTIIIVVLFRLVWMIVKSWLALSDLLWHWWKSDALWEVWQWINETSSLSIIMIE